MSSSSSDSDYSEENLDDFLIKASSVLSEEKHPDRQTMIESLKHHLSSIFHEQSEMENFFKTLNDIIFSSKSKKNGPQKISNIKPFKLYPLIFSFNPKSSFFYVDYFLTSLQLCASEENRRDFPYFGTIFADVINAFFSEGKKNKKIVKKNNTLLEPNKKAKLYEKLLNFCNNNMKTNKKTEQSFGCLFLTQLLEKCPLSKEDKNLENLYKIISEYLDDRWFECKLDLLNCTISLISTAGKNFKPYANSCILKILDYLTDEDWMKRKLAVNIVFTLLFFCKEEVLSVKENITEFLNILEDDPVNEVREVCLQTLDFLEESDPNKKDDKEEEEKDNNINEINENFNNQKNKNNKASNKILKKKNVKGQSFQVKLKKEKEMLEKLEKEYNEKKNKYNYNKNLDRGKIVEDINENNNEEKSINDKINIALYEILQQLKKIQEEQNELNSMYEDVKQTIDKNYSSLSERIKAVENKSPYYNYKTGNNSSGKK